MTMRKLIIVLMAFLLVSCASPEAPEEEPNDITVVGGGTDAYSILVPFANSPLRQEYANTYRETDLMEISILEEIVKRESDGIVILGDILDKHANINSSVLSRAVRFLDKLRKLSLLFVMIGNHDLKSNDQFFSEDHPFLALRFWENTILVDKTVEYLISNQKFIFVPYVPPGRFLEALSYLPNGYKDATCIFAHQEFKGANLGSQISEQGDEWDIFDPYVVSGHIHDYQELENILYIGTPIQNTYSDCIDRYIGYISFLDVRKVEKISLQNVIKKKIIKLYPEDLKDYTVEKDPMMKIKAKIKCEVNQSVILSKNVKILEMIKSGYKIFYEIITKNGYDYSMKSNVIIEKFSDLLIKNLKKDKNENLYNIYQEIIFTKD